MKKNIIFKSIAPLLGVVALVLVGKYHYDKSFEGNDSIKLITNTSQINTLEALILQKEFENHVLYIDI